MRSDERLFSYFGERCFLDTNILIYCFDHKAPEKRRVSQFLLDKAISSGNGVISHQVIQEFVSVAQSKFKIPLTQSKTVGFLDDCLFPLWKSYPSRELYLSALEIQKSYETSWWDSLVIASALDCECRFLITEDLTHGLAIREMEIVNPFN